MDEHQLHEKIFEELREIRSDVKANNKMTADGFGTINGRLRKNELDVARLQEKVKTYKGVKLDGKIVGAIVAALATLGYVITELVKALVK